MFGKNNNQKGFTLAVALVIVGLLTSVLTGITFVKKGETQRREAAIAGWEGAKIARAARIYSRDQIESRPTLANDLSPTLGTGPEEISITTLINNSLLPQNFARNDGAGNYFNALGQPIRIFMANWPIKGNPALASTVPTAFVVFEDTAKTTPELMQHIVQSIRSEKVAVATPIYNGTTNITGSCNGGALTAAVWDSGCMDINDYATLTGSAFVPGSFVIPTWRAVSFDTRAVMRFPQPEQNGLQTMLTDLKMANMNDCASNPATYLNIPNDNGGNIASDLCRAVSDNRTTLADNRRSIMNTNSISTNSLITDPQSGGVYTNNNTGVRNTTAEEIYALDVVGTLTTTAGDTIVHTSQTNVAGTLSVDRNINVSGPSGTLTPASASIGGTLSGRDARADTLNVSSNTVIQGDMSAGNIANVNNSTARNSVVTQNLVATPVNNTIYSITVGSAAKPGTASLLGNTAIETTSVNGSRTVNGKSYITGQLITKNNISGSVTNINGSTALSRNTTSQNTSAHNVSYSATCVGDCPLRTISNQCRQLEQQGFETYASCMARNR